MKWSFRKSIKLGPVRVNLSKSGVGGSIGVKGFRKGIDAKGRSYTHASIPGTGIYSRSYDRQDRQTQSGEPNSSLTNDSSPSKGNAGLLPALAISLGIFIAILAMGADWWFGLLLAVPALFMTLAFFNPVKNSGGETPMFEEVDVDAIDTEIDEMTEQFYADKDEAERKAAAKDCPFQALGLNPTATLKEVETAYRQLIKQYHPDRTTGLGPEIQEVAKRKTQEINDAYAQCLDKLQGRDTA